MEVVRTVCEESEEVVDNEVCYYVYNKESLDTEASTVEVEYAVKCEEETVNTCPPQSGYGYNSYCKNKKMDVCYNVPKVNPAKTSVTVSFPVAEKKCENKPVKIPKVTCNEVEVGYFKNQHILFKINICIFQAEKCFQLPYTVEEEEELERCTTKLGPPRCEKTPVSLPKQICVDIQHLPAPAPLNHYAAVQPIQPASLPYLG